MIDMLRRMGEGDVKEWYKKHMTIYLFNRIVNEAADRGYELDPKSGLLIKQVYPEDIIKNLGHTVVDIIFPRPTDLHFHKDVDEAIYIEYGSGSMYIQEKKSFKIINLYRGSTVFIPRNRLHAFRPDKENALEVRLECSGILDPKKEICKERFDAFAPWIEYFGGK